MGATIRVGNVQNDGQVEQFIKNNYGQGCTYTKTYLSGSGNDSLYGITATDEVNGNSDLSECGLRNEGGYEILYYPSSHRIIGLVLGQQECRFDQLGGRCVDQLILSSLSRLTP